VFPLRRGRRRSFRGARIVSAGYAGQRIRLGAGDAARYRHICEAQPDAVQRCLQLKGVHRFLGAHIDDQGDGTIVISASVISSSRNA